MGGTRTELGGAVHVFRAPVTPSVRRSARHRGWGKRQLKEFLARGRGGRTAAHLRPHTRDRKEISVHLHVTPPAHHIRGSIRSIHYLHDYALSALLPPSAARFLVRLFLSITMPSRIGSSTRGEPPGR